MHKVEKSDDVKRAVERLVDLLMRDESSEERL
jgi:hypothetical protein